MTDSRNGPSGGGGPRPRVVIVGAGFAGLALAKGLRRVAADVVVVDRRNHHAFQPLLYQVATASLAAPDIAAPIRKVLARSANTSVILGEAVGIDVERRMVRLRDGEIGYDALCVCAGVSHSYFGNEQWSRHAPGLKTIEDALRIRQRFLLAFEAAERETDPVARHRQLTFVVVGGGPTGVELAGAMAEMAHRSIPSDFRNIDTTSARIILVQAGDRLLEAFPPDLSERARRDLLALGVQVRLSAPVSGVDERGVSIGEARIEAGCVVWAAGVAAEPLAGSLGAPMDRTGRVQVEPNLGAPGRPEVFVLGDLANVKDAAGQPVPGVAPAATQMGRYVAGVLAERVRAGRIDRPAPGERPFVYRDKGIMATIGRARAVGVVFGLKVTGFVAWALWALVHVANLIEFRNRLLVMIRWAWAYLAWENGARLITGDADLAGAGLTEQRRGGTNSNEAPGRATPDQ